MTIDLRSWAAFRMALGSLVLSQSILLAYDFKSFYQATGVCPPLFWSESLLRALLFGVIPLFAIFLLIGFVTRLSTLLCLLGIVIVQEANPQILQGGDVLLRLLLFWSLFLPLGEIWSIDARWMKLDLSSYRVTMYWATWGFVLQICFVYWFAALLKISPLWLQNGNPLFYALNIEHFATPFGVHLTQYPSLLRIITFVTPYFELAGPLLLFLPYRRDACRFAAVTLFLGFHLIGMESLLRIGLFPWVCASAWLVFLPDSFWDWLGTRNSDSVALEKKPLKRVGSKQKRSAASMRTRTLLDFGCSALVIASLLDVLTWNIASLRGDDYRQWMKQNDTFGNILRLDQRWNMYAPYPRAEHGWLVVPADLADGSTVDLFTGQPVSWDKPADIGAYFGDDRWRRYLSNLFNDQNPQALQGYADYLVRQWNQKHSAGQKVLVVTITFMKQVTMPDLSITPPEQEPLYFHAY